MSNAPAPGYQIAASSVLGLEFAYLARLGLRSATDKKLADTANLIDVMLAPLDAGSHKPAPHPAALAGRVDCQPRMSST